MNFSSAMTLAAISALLMITSPAAAERAAEHLSDQTSNIEISKLIPVGWRETVLSVKELDVTTAFYVDILGWEVRARGSVPSEQLAAWELPKTATAEFALVANPGSRSGFVRIISFKGVPQTRIRPHDQSWETGGIFNMNIRVSDMASIYEKASDAGWQASSAPVRLSFGPFVVWEWIPRSADGVRVAVIERVTPSLENWPNLKTSSRTFNSTQIVADMDRARAFYQDILGFETYLENRSASALPEESVLGLSQEAMTKIVRNVRVVSPKGAANEGSIELLEFEGYTGRDFSDRATPPNLGNLMLRFPVPDIAALAQYLESKEVMLEYQPVERQLAPYGTVKILAIRAPDGAWLEFFEPLGK